jgi:hypothetical protein
MLHAVAREHLETMLQEARDASGGAGLPRYVVRGSCPLRSLLGVVLVLARLRQTTGRATPYLPVSFLAM